MVVTPQHDYYALTPSGQQEIPKFMRRWITPREPPGQNVVCSVAKFLVMIDYLYPKSHILKKLIFFFFNFLKDQVLTVGALHGVDSSMLRSAALTWHNELAPLPKPLLVVNIGGPTCKPIL